jgi:hypothetical protein
MQISFSAFTLAIALASVGATAWQSDADISAAIKVGLEKKASRLSTFCVASPGFKAAITARTDGGVRYNGSHIVHFEGPLGFIARNAELAAKAYREFGPADATDAMRAPLLHVTIIQDDSQWSAGAVNVSPDVTGLVLTNSSKRIWHPSTFEAVPSVLTGASGAKPIAAEAAFALDEITFGSDLTAIVLTPAGERRCTITKDDQARLKIAG